MSRSFGAANVPIALGLVVFGAIAGGGCTSRSKVIGVETEEPPSLLGDNADSGSPEASVGACPSNECPPGRVTCPNTRFPCGVDLSSDDENCGACGVRCPTDQAFYDRNGGVMHCVAGVCRLSCAGDRADCNGLPDDGCEVPIGRGSSDMNNCGSCGVKCQHACIGGACDCPGGELCSDGECHDINVEDGNCGGCGLVCPPSNDPPFPAEWHMSRSCRNGLCNQPACEPGWVDCNDDFGVAGGDGCETSVRDDVDNCGACGNACSPGEQCVGGACDCACGAACFTAINSDIDNCGTCGFVCPGDRRSIRPRPELGLDPAHGKPTCEQGACGYACTVGWGDCDDDIMNGCETELLDDPLNCGACGVRCNGIEGQACIDGHCLMKECDVK